jgi:hypothetical protein
VEFASQSVLSETSPPAEQNFIQFCRALSESLRRQLDSARAGEHLGIRSTTQDALEKDAEPSVPSVSTPETVTTGEST